MTGNKQHERDNSAFFSGLFMVLLGVGMALTNGIPLRVQGIANDGANARDLGKDPAALRAFWIQLSINARQAEGVAHGRAG